MYTPNFNDPRVINKTKHAIGMAVGIFSSDKPREMSTRFIDKHFGHQGHNLSKYLRKQLLITADDHYSRDKHKCKSYLLRLDGVKFLRKRIGEDTQPIAPGVARVQWATDTWGDQLATADFVYEEKSHRLFNPIQNIKTELRTLLLRQYNLNYTYDITTAAPTLLYQQSFTTSDATGEVLETIEYYLENKSAVRKRISQQCQIDPKTAKQIINSLFAGARLSTYSGGSIMRMLDADTSRVSWLLQDQFLTLLRSDISAMWQTLKCLAPVEYITTKTGKTRKRAFNSRDKWNIYFKLERSVLNEVRSYLDLPEISSKYFLEHDGFVSQKEIDVTDLSYWVEAGTGYRLIFEQKKEEYNYNQITPSVTHLLGKYKYPEPVALSDEEMKKKYSNFIPELRRI